jgi:hypothetical protein
MSVQERLEAAEDGNIKEAVKWLIERAEGITSGIEMLAQPSGRSHKGYTETNDDEFWDYCLELVYSSVSDRPEGFPFEDWASVIYIDAIYEVYAKTCFTSG